MSDEWATRYEQPILLTSTNHCITEASGTQGLKRKMSTGLEHASTSHAVQLYNLHKYSKIMTTELVVASISKETNTLYM
jgi:hypothetical protein